MRPLFHFYKEKPEWMSDFYSSMRDYFAGKWLLLAMWCSVFIVGLILVSILFTSNKEVLSSISSQNKRSTTILHELNDINSALHRLENNPENTKQQKLALQSLENKIVSVQKSITELAKKSDIQQISNQLSSVKEDMDNQMDGLKKAVSQNTDGKQFIAASNLPFRVIAVDVVAGQPYVSLEFTNHILPLAVGDMLAGWRLVSADYASGNVEFENEKNQFIKVSLGEN